MPYFFNGLGWVDEFKFGHFDYSLRMGFFILNNLILFSELSLHVQLRYNLVDLIAIVLNFLLDHSHIAVFVQHFTNIFLEVLHDCLLNVHTG